jgi:hypothetical protein
MVHYAIEEDFFSFFFYDLVLAHRDGKRFA